MAKKKKQIKNKSFWFGVGLIAALLTAPNMTVLKVLSGEVEPLALNTVRSLILIVITAPFMLLAWKKYSRQNIAYAAAAGVSMTIAVTSAIYALKYSQASYVVVLALMSPIMLILLSKRMIKERISRRAVMGISIAALGALVAVALPIMIKTGASFTFYPLATLLIAVNCVFFPLGIIYLRKAHEAGLPLTAASGITSIIILLVCGIASLALHGVAVEQFSGLTTNMWLAILYSSVIVAFVARIMSVSSFERIGSVATSGLSYINTVIAILIPVIILDEQLSSAVVLGGALILLGVYLTEQHRSRHHPHAHVLKHH